MAVHIHSIFFRDGLNILPDTSDAHPTTRLDYSRTPAVEVAKGEPTLHMSSASHLLAVAVGRVLRAVCVGFRRVTVRAESGSPASRQSSV